MPALRLLIVGNDLGYFISHRLPLARSAIAAGYDVHVAIPYTTDAQLPPLDGAAFHQIELQRNSLSLMQDLRTLLSLRRLVRALQPDIVHNFTLKPVLYGGSVARLAEVPLVINAVTGLGSLFGEQTPKMRRLRRLVLPGLRYACGSRRVRTVFQNYDDQAEFVAAGVCSLSNSVVIRGSGVDTAVFLPAAEPDGQPVVICPSRMLWEKGVGEFVDAARRLKAQGCSARFALVGATDSNPSSVSEVQLKQWEAEGIVEWWGRRNDMPEVFRLANLVCLPSRYREGVPKVLIEAASCGRAIVTTDMPGCREIVLDGENGLLVPPGNVARLAEALRRLIEQPALRRQMGDRGRARVVSDFSLEVVLRETLALYANARS
jgi:glycosyltransferase involved in cell wall biosynthesis